MSTSSKMTKCAIDLASNRFSFLNFFVLNGMTKKQNFLRSPFGFWYNGRDESQARASRLARTPNIEEISLNNHLENIIGQWVEYLFIFFHKR